MHGAWCWDLLIPELERRGNRALAVDLPGHGHRAAERATLAGYRDAVLEVLLPGDVLVGHSLGTTAITLAADAAESVGHLVYLAGAVPVEGRSVSRASAEVSGAALELTEAEAFFQSNLRVTPDGGSFLLDREAAHRCFYHDCPPDVAHWGRSRLTPQQFGVLAEPVSVPRFWTLDPSRSYVVCADDRVWSARVSEIHADRLGVCPLRIPGSHSPFLSRPAELAELLVGAAGPVASERAPRRPPVPSARRERVPPREARP
jgi:pimeloyl-ACP methyl ester carboxylesterase